MAKVTDLGYTNGLVAGETAWEPTTHQLDWANEFALVSEVPGKVVYTDLTAPSDRPANITIAQRVRANVYAGTAIDPALYLPSRKGVDTLVEVTCIPEVTDSEAAEYLKQFPIRAALNLSVPNTPYLSASQLGTIIQRLTQAIIQTNPSVVDGWSAGLTGLLRGALRK